MEGKVTPGSSQLSILFPLPRFLFLTTFFSKLDARNKEKEIKCRSGEKSGNICREVS